MTDEVYPFQMNRWYQQIKFVPNYQDRIQNSNVTIERLLIGQMSDFDNFDELLNRSRIYEDVPFNSTIVLDLMIDDRLLHLPDSQHHLLRIFCRPILLQ